MSTETHSRVAASRVARCWISFGDDAERPFHMVATIDGASVVTECLGRGELAEIVAVGDEDTPVEERCRRCQGVERVEIGLDEIEEATRP